MKNLNKAIVFLVGAFFCMGYLIGNSDKSSEGYNLDWIFPTGILLLIVVFCSIRIIWKSQRNITKYKSPDSAQY